MKQLKKSRTDDGSRVEVAGSESISKDKQLDTDASMVTDEQQFTVDEWTVWSRNNNYQKIIEI